MADIEEEVNLKSGSLRTDKKKKRKKLLLQEATAAEMAEIEEEANMTTLKEEANLEPSDVRMDKKKNRKKLLLKEAAAAEKRGICYLSRIPPRMDPLKLRQILSQYGEIQRIYLTPEDPAAQIYRKRAGGFRGQEFSEGWVEFSKKSVAKMVAKMLNGEQIGGKKRSLFYYDLWNIKYLSKFRWDDLTEEIAYKNAIREQKLALEISAAKRERDLYLSKVDQSRALTSIRERIKKKQKVQNELGMASELAPEQQAPKVIRQFPQTRPVDNAEKSKPRLSKDILAGVFGVS
ncbi:pre-rRNA-processing protein esf2 isoform X2 [Diospyros lotus]|uniref:pre-rRNA-processing protein esf2 isoform X2 n=1 Tax=Diospyros lotus TaxID=55363 RepID=UPI0022563F1F|nr:pre-rRNA-processing protein esf2 isoform X2 [Diospyros lotus]